MLTYKALMNLISNKNGYLGKKMQIGVTNLYPSKPVNNYENGGYLCHCLKTRQSEIIWRKSS